MSEYTKDDIVVDSKWKTNNRGLRNNIYTITGIEMRPTYFGSGKMHECVCFDLNLNSSDDIKISLMEEVDNFLKYYYPYHETIIDAIYDKFKHMKKSF